MATAAQHAELADAVEQCANLLKGAKHVIDQLLAKNSALAVDWNSVNADDITGETDATPSEISNAIGSLSAFAVTLWTTHGGNFEKLAKAIV